MSIYKPCDIRGDEVEELSAELYRSWGRTLGRQVGAASKVLVGGDVRASTPEFLAALIEGLCESGADTVDLGQIPTPMIYYARRRLEAAACVVVTASHNPAGINGLKWLLGDEPPKPEDIELLRHGAEQHGAEKHGAEESGSTPPDHKPSEPRQLDVSFDYVAWLQETWVDSLSAQCHVVIDPMHGCMAQRARRYLQAIFPQCLFSAIHDEPDPAFAGRSPDCSQPALLEELCESVYHHRAHLGLAFDGDGDRVALVDGEGVPLTPEETAWCFLQSLGDQLQGASFVYDLKFSHHVPATAEQLGAEPLVERSGHTFIRRRMLESNALFGAEVSGHLFFRELGGSDDALYAACHIIAYLTRTGRSLGELRRECPPAYMTPDLRVPVAVEGHEAVLAQVRASWPDHPQTTVDGIRVEFPQGWALIRSSVTEPAMTFRFEAFRAKELPELVWHFSEALPGLGDELLDQYGRSGGPSCSFGRNMPEE